MYNIIIIVEHLYRTYRKRGGTMVIAERIKQLRQESGMSQAALAQRLGVTRSSVNAWEMGISTPTIQYVIALAQVWHVTTDYLLCIHSTKTIDISGLGETETKLVNDLLNYFELQNHL